jgi:hypothetical protein
MFESLVRPFQSPALAPRTRIIASSKKQPPQIATLSWGAAGTMPVAVAGILQGGVSIKIDSSALHSELYRITDPVRIENPDDSTQFVMVDRIKKIGFTSKPQSGVQTSTLDQTTGATTTTTTGGGSSDADYALKNV